jgi:amino acid adenylation domain-containing protein
VTGPGDVPDIATRFARHAGAQPGAAAVRSDGAWVTYRELDRWSSAIARDLAAAGVQTGDGVAVLAARDAATVAGMLGVLRAGAWYLLIDQQQPPGRRDLLLRRSGCAAVLASQAEVQAAEVQAAGLPAGSLAPREAEPWQRPADPGQPAYMCFTSGTTAAPKAVLVSRGSLSGYVQALADRVGIGPRAVMGGLCPAEWDGFTVDTWVPLGAGATAVRCPVSARGNPDLIARFIAADGVQIMLLPTVIGQLVLDSRHLAAAHDLRHLLIGGDRLTRRAVPGAGYELWNAYGPTETTVIASIGRVAADGPAEIPLGSPLPGVTMEIVDDRLAAVPPGQPGEILIGGPGVALGYLGDPRATAAAFVPGPQGRRYRTGDHGRLLPDGQFAFLGRRDRQVSVHGRRIELDGVTAALRRVPGVVAAAAEVTGTGAAAALVAFVTAAPGRDLTPAAVHAGLADWLSAQQLPDRIAVVPAIPVPDGRRLTEDQVTALLGNAAPVASAPAAPAAAAAGDDLPGDEIDELVTDAWAALTGGPRPRMRDNFFLNGGNSLLAVQLVQQLQGAFEVELTLLSFFDTPTPRHLAGLLRAELERQLDALPEAERARLLQEHT